MNECANTRLDLPRDRDEATLGSGDCPRRVDIGRRKDSAVAGCADGVSASHRQPNNNFAADRLSGHAGSAPWRRATAGAVVRVHSTG